MYCFETSADFQRSTRGYISEDEILKFFQLVIWLLETARAEYKETLAAVK
jgi:predicted metal-dependent hydrolase